MVRMGGVTTFLCRCAQTDGRMNCPPHEKLEKGRKNKKKVRKGRVKARDEKDDESLQTFTAAKCFIVALLYLIFYPTSALAP